MSEHRYKLQEYKGISTKHTCVSCKGKRCFTNYIDTQDNSIVHPTVGRCERLSKCGYHLAPKTYFINNGIVPSDNWTAAPPEPPKPTSYFDEATVINSLQKKEQNNLLTFLATKFTDEQIDIIIQNYLIGTTKSGGTIFWQADTDGRIRAGKIIIYNTDNGKRNKSIFPRVNWAHIMMKRKDFNMKQCFFGEHLLALFHKHPVAIVESEKTAIIASVYLPEYLWLACGGLDFLSEARCSALKGRTVVLFPDLGSFGKQGHYYLDTEAQQYYFKSNGVWNMVDEPNPDVEIKTARSGPPKSAFEKWKDKANHFGFSISDMLETHATPTEKEEGLDLADLLLRFDVNDFKGDTANEVIPDSPNTAETEIEQYTSDSISLSKPIIETEDKKTILTPELIELHTKYTAAESAGVLDNHPQRSWIGTMWEGVLMYAARPQQQQYYIQELQIIQL
jgi:hypothetical protein